MKNTIKQNRERGNMIKTEKISQNIDTCTSCGAARNLFPTSATQVDLY
jgi:ferredoxin